MSKTQEHERRLINKMCTHSQHTDDDHSREGRNSRGVSRAVSERMDTRREGALLSRHVHYFDTLNFGLIKREKCRIGVVGVL